MQVHGIVVSVDIDIQVPKNGGGTYPGSRLTYRETSSGKVQEQGFHNQALKFKPDVKNALVSLNTGDAIIIDKEKNDKGFWEVQSITKNDGTQAQAQTPATSVSGAKATASPKSTYETPEERAQRQVYIIRQSSISSAVELLAANGGKKNTVDDVINVAKAFEAYVFGIEFDDGSIAIMKDDTDGII